VDVGVMSWWWWLIVVVVNSSGGERFGTYLPTRGCLSSSLMVVRGLRVVGWGCGGLFPTRAAG